MTQKSKDNQEVLDHNEQGDALHNLEKYEEAIACYDEAIKLDPKDNEAWDLKCGILLKQKKHEEVIACYDERIRLNPTEDFFWSEKGNLLDKLGRNEEATLCHNECDRLVNQSNESYSQTTSNS